jgi:hypothetical protein
MRPKQIPALALRLASQTTMGITLGLIFCLLIALIDRSNVTSLIAHSPDPGTTAFILVSFFVLLFGAGATLTGIVLIEPKKR